MRSNETGMVDVVQRLIPDGRIDPAHLTALLADATKHTNPDLSAVLEWRDRYAVSGDVPIVTVKKCWDDVPPPIVTAKKCWARSGLRYSKRHSIVLWLELETKCNIRCGFCYNYWKDDVHRAPQSLPTEVLLEYLDDLLNQVDCDQVALSGGEPLLNPDLDLYIEFFTAREIPTVLTTNGTLLSRERLVSLQENGLTTVQIPLHSAHPKTHDTLSGAKCWRRSVEALTQACRLDLDSAAVFVATRQNISHLIGVLELLFLIGIHRVIFNRFLPSGAGILNRASLSVPDDIVLDVLTEANEHASRLGSIIELGTQLPFAQSFSALRNIRVQSCWSEGLHRQFTVDCAGNLKHCSQSPEPLGNLANSSFPLLASRVQGMKHSLAQRGVEYCYCTSVELGENSAKVVR